MSCGNPPAVVNGLVELVNGTTAWQVNIVIIIIVVIVFAIIIIFAIFNMLFAVNCCIHVLALLLQLREREHHHPPLHMPRGCQVVHFHDHHDEDYDDED